MWLETAWLPWLSAGGSGRSTPRDCALISNKSCPTQLINLCPPSEIRSALGSPLGLLLARFHVGLRPEPQCRPDLINRNLGHRTPFGSFHCRPDFLPAKVAVHT